MTAKQLREFILWLRKEKIAYTTLSAGGVTLDGVIDMKMAESDKKTIATMPSRETMYERYGAELLKQPTVKPSEVVPDEAMEA